MTIMVTGGAGFIGSAVIRMLIRETSHKVVNVDCLTYAGSLDSTSSVSASERYCFEQADICDHREISRILSSHSPDAIMHLAAESHVDRSIAGPAKFIQTNIVGTSVLLEESRKYFQESSSFKFHHISTDEVFGDLGAGSKSFSEDSPYAPSSPYSASKASSDHLVRAWHRTYDLPVVISNSSNNYGPWQFPEKLIPLSIINALNDKPITVFGDGSQVRDWLFVEDHAAALLKVLQEGAEGETYNIGASCEKTNLEVVKLICSILDELQPRNSGSYQEFITFVKDRPGHDKRYAVDAEKFIGKTGWKPQIDFEEGIGNTVKWYMANQEWCRRAIKYQKSQ